MTDPKTTLEFRYSRPTLPDGFVALTAEELEREILARLESGSSSRKQALWDLAVLYSMTNRREESLESFNKLAVLADGPEERARCHLSMGRLREMAGDFEGAVSFYSAAFGMEPGDTDTWYWINNNLGYSLVQLARYQEAEPYLRRCFAIDPARANAFKNLGLAFLGQDRYAEAADHFVRATQVNAADFRSLGHLEELVAAHPELLTEVPDLEDKLKLCRVAVQKVAAVQPNLQEQWNKLRRRQTRPWWAFWR